MADDYIPTVRIRRPARVSTDDRGRSVWTDTIETAQLELVSTTQLQVILESEDEDSRSAIRQVARSKEEGVLARDPQTGLYEVISDADLKAILDGEDPPPIRRQAADVTWSPPETKAGSGTDELSLVSTQMLRKIIRTDDEPSPAKPAVKGKPSAAKKDSGGGFDPYNSG